MAISFPNQRRPWADTPPSSAQIGNNASPSEWCRVGDSDEPRRDSQHSCSTRFLSHRRHPGGLTSLKRQWVEPRGSGRIARPPPLRVSTAPSMGPRSRAWAAVRRRASRSCRGPGMLVGTPHVAPNTHPGPLFQNPGSPRPHPRRAIRTGTWVLWSHC